MVRVSVAFTTEIVKEMVSIQDPYPVAALGLGRLLTGTYLLAAQLKEGFHISVRFQGNGPIGELYAECHPDGRGRAYCQNPHADLPLKNGQLDLAGAIGEGSLVVSRGQPFQKQPHTSIVPIMTGEIASDLTHYMRQSNQTLSVIALSTSLNATERVPASGGVLVELMPETPESIIEVIEKKVASAEPLSSYLTKGLSAVEIARHFSHSTDLITKEEPLTLQFHCPCSVERVHRTLLMLGRASLSEMILKGEPINVTCEFCGRKYAVSQDKLRDLSLELPEKATS